MTSKRNPFLFGLIGTIALASTAVEVNAADLDLANSPLFLSSPAKANILAILDNSNSMDEAANGAAVGSDAPNSKSEIARNAVEALIDTYLNRVNLGLMAYQQAGVDLRHIHNSPYDASYNPANYDPGFTGARASTTKKYRLVNPSSPGDFIYYNVALPFYAWSDQGRGFCYSPTADASNDFHDGEDPSTGPWDTYRCFRNKSGPSDVLPTWGNGASEAAAGYSSYFGSYTFFPTDSDFAQGILDFGRFMNWQHVGLTWFANSSPGRGYLHVPISELDASQKTALDTKLAVSQFASNRPTNPAWPLQNAGLTPMEGTLLTALDYFEGNLSAADEGYGAGIYPLPESCGKDFVVLATDGLPSTGQSGNSVSNPAQAISDTADAATALHTAGVETYIIGFALPYGVDPATLDTIASSGGTVTAYAADDPASLTDALDAILTDIIDKTGAAASAAANSTTLTTGSQVYQARFNSATWSGQLLAFDIDLDGIIDPDYNWDTGQKISGQSPASRKILTISRDTNDGIPFTWADISAQTTDTSQANLLNQDASSPPVVDNRGDERVAFLRGADVTGFRTRASKLGDIIHSSPHYVGPPRAGYPDSDYATFVSNNSSREPIIYVGANDGMLHGIHVSSGPTQGEEAIAYVPGPVYENLSRLTDPDYGQTLLPHRYYVDGSPMVADAKLGSSWKTVLASGLNHGGQGYYALDVTSPSGFAQTTTAAANLVLWEFTDEDDADLGYSYNQPSTNYDTTQSAQIAKVNNGKWALIVGNGYNNDEADGHPSLTGHAVLFILFIEDGADGSWVAGDYVKIDTGVGSVGTANGLATPVPVDIDGDGDIDSAYAGDLQGNLWKFDLSSSNTNSWSVGKLYAAADSGGQAQSITTIPMALPHPDGGFMVGFGTGQYLGHADLSTTDTHTLYGIWDSATDGSVTEVTGGRTNLVEQEVIAVENDYQSSGKDYRITSENPVDYHATPTPQKGWYLDLPTSGERVGYNPIPRDGRFVFVTLIPDTADPCAAGGTGWLMELDYLSGGPLDESPFDVNGDHAIGDDDFITYTYGGNNETGPASGVNLGIGIPATPTVIGRDEDTEVKVISGSSGALATLIEGRSDPTGRLSWKQIIAD